MKSGLTIAIIFFLIAGSCFAQIKPPVAETDIVTAFFDCPTSFNALANDYSYDGDSLILWMITGTWIGTSSAYFEDSTIYYSPGSHSTYALSDTVYYMIKDVTTGLYSDEGKAIINFERIKSEHLDINNINAQINCVGNQFRTLNYFNLIKPEFGFEAPKGGGVSSIYNSTLWVGGMDENNNIHTACERNRTGRYPYASGKGYDFWPGPVMDTVNYNVDYLFDNNKIWELTREEIRNHIINYNLPGYQMPENIENWPAHGNTDLGAAHLLAPFVDLNDNQLYEPELGESPAVKGDNSFSFIFNDDFDEHTESFGRKLGIEVFGQAYAFDCPDDSAFYNTIFLSYQIINRSDTNYVDLYIGNYTNLMIGNPGDDLLVCDTILNAFYAFNEDDFDDTTSTYYPGYMHHPPAQAVVFLNIKMDNFMYSKFPYPPSDSNFSADPNDDYEYYNFMKAIWNDSTHLTYGGAGHLGGQSVNYAFTGNPITNEGWTQLNSGIEEHGLHAIASTGPYDFLTGDTVFLELAYVFARDYQGDNFSAVGLLKERIEQIKWFYENDSTPCGEQWSGLTLRNYKSEKLVLYPNPVKDVLNLEFDFGKQKAEYSIYNFTGQKVKTGVIYRNSNTISVENLRDGYYLIRVNTDEGILVGKFAKLKSVH
ncbi:MAG: hypothetical protein B6D61_04320 [Bacteroidetes bacterium 4484_249]|nr:MAG: hypothetical protein B6D61_04320 [Bacteroidetes bacterium 4484_249]